MRRHRASLQWRVSIRTVHVWNDVETGYLIRYFSVYGTNSVQLFRNILYGIYIYEAIKSLAWLDGSAGNSSYAKHVAHMGYSLFLSCSSIQVTAI